MQAEGKHKEGQNENEGAVSQVRILEDLSQVEIVYGEECGQLWLKPGLNQRKEIAKTLTVDQKVSSKSYIREVA